MSNPTVAVIGNPNTGKTSLFNALTGARQKVANWPGVTVEKRTGRMERGRHRALVVDLPGIYALAGEDGSTDEGIARAFLDSGEADVVVNVVDAVNLERNLYLTVQLLEQGYPVVVALNMMDSAKAAGIAVDAGELERRLGCPVVAMVASRSQGVDELADRVAALAARPDALANRIDHGPAVEAAAARIAARLDPDAPAAAPAPATLRRAFALIDGDAEARRRLDPELRERIDGDLAELAATHGEPVDLMLADGRYGFILEVTRASIQRRRRLSRPVSDRIDRLVLHRLFGLPLFLALMYAMFVWTINVGGAFIDFFDVAAGTLFVDGPAHWLGLANAPDWLIVGLAHGIGGGLQTVATFIPIIAFLFLFLAVLEDTGYMARAAFVMDRFMRAIGLPGKASLPLLVGFGCNVPAVMATRTLGDERDRKTAVMMIPFMSCGARVPVYALFAAAFFPTNGQNLVFALYLIGILVAVLTGVVLKRTLLAGGGTPMVMELPRYHVPTPRNVLLRTWDRLRAFIVGAGRIIVLMVALLSVLNALTFDGRLVPGDSEDSVLAGIGREATVAFAPMGISEENWPATVGIFTGIFAKEAVVGTLDNLYTSLAEPGPAGAAGEDGFDFLGGLAAAVATIPENLGALGGSLVDPMGIGVGPVDEPIAAAEAQEVGGGTFGAMAERFDGRAGAFAYLLFVLLYFPCAAAMGAVYRELGAGWTVFAGLWTTGIAYGAATVFYQASVFARAPETAFAWIAGVLASFALTVWAMRTVGARRRAEAVAPTVAGRPAPDAAGGPTG
jgi:ferrous iron transport protein B